MSQLSNSQKQSEYDKFYSAEGINKAKLLAANETKEGANDGYMCICTYCNALGSKKCIRECCDTAKPCTFFEKNQETIDRQKSL